MLAIVLLLASYAAVVALFSAASFDRTGAPGDEKFYCGLDCYVVYSVRNVERTETIGDTGACGEFYVIAVRSHFDKRTIGPRRGDRPLRPDPPTLTLIDPGGHSYPLPSAGRQAWEAAHGQSHSLDELLRPGEWFEATWVFDVPAEAKNLRMFPGWYGFPSYLMMGDETSPSTRRPTLHSDAREASTALIHGRGTG